MVVEIDCELFDAYEATEFRQQVLNALWTIRPGEETDWVIDRIYAYLNFPKPAQGHWTREVLEDFTTVIMLLKRLGHVDESERKRAFGVMLDVWERVVDPMVKPDHGTLPIKDVAVVVCGHLKRRPEDYNDRTRELVRASLETNRSVSGEEHLRIVQRLILLAMKVEDISLVPSIERFIAPLRKVDTEWPHITIEGKLEYLTLDESELAITTDALARQAVSYLRACLEEKEEAGMTS